MINKRELRKGNWVIYNAGNLLSKDSYMQIEDVNDTVAKQSKPIPITPEILEACGFVKRSGSGVAIIAIAYEDSNSPCTLQRTGDGIQVCRSGIGAITSHIDSLHQLQNLYFALTGQELSIKELSKTIPA